jgi:cysteine synthase
MIAAVTPTPPIRVVFASGGTGGHLYPGLAVARTLAEEQPGTQSLFLVSEKPIEYYGAHGVRLSLNPRVSARLGKCWNVP